MSENVVPIGVRRFKVAPPGHEKSKAAVLAENQELRGKLIGMQQLLAAMLLNLPEEPAITFNIADLEQVDPRCVEIAITDTTVTLSIRDENEQAPNDSA